MSELKIKKIPYGVSNYERIVQNNCYYVDKTMYLETIENAGDYLFFIRPRRFGKSLFLAVLHGYYDVYFKERFDELYKGTWIHTHPTAERGSYLVLPFNFSAIDPTADKIDASFLNHIQGRADSFARKYSDFLGKDKDHLLEKIEASRSGSDILSMIIKLCDDAQQKLYVIIDEYDNFANTILTTSGKNSYKDLTRGEGFFRSFFNVLKTGTTGMKAPITRLFITGVSPVTLDDVTSGFNIGTNVSLEPGLNRMLGFTRDDVAKMIDYYRANDTITHSTEYILEIMTEWYGNYLFSKKDIVDLYNPDMVLYFINKYMLGQGIPDELIDRNVRMDYGKLRHLIILDRGEAKTTNGNFSRLKQIIEEEEIISNLVTGFPIEKMTHTDNFLSLLFYFGLLSIKKKAVQDEELVLQIPNETIRRLFYAYIKEGYEETGVFSLDLYTYNRLMHGMAVRGEWEPLFNYICGLLRESMSLRDLITGEKSIQAFLNVYLGLSNLFIIHTEKELNKGYADIVMEPFVAVYESLKYSYVLEIKYIKPEGKRKKKPAPAIIEKLKSEAEEQLRNYSIDEKFMKSMEKTEVKKLVLIFYGSDLVYIG
ncbi:MAG TPA: AAA family ATPase [Candidatus Deferrimicrobium sp.]|nr:AAA family ATPase [Candidatus Kapabacteria bacterium]HLP57954.1 AAA family ATPase [Candidatus Deferrimicrobium sp.]